MTSKRYFALFDFDGTITKRDTLLDFVLFVFGCWRTLAGFIFLIPVFILLIIKIIDNNIAKQKLFTYFFSGMDENLFNALCTDYCEKRFPAIIKDEAFSRIKYHKDSGHTLIIISASIVNWIDPFAHKLGFDEVIATIPEIENGVLTGKFLTKNCSGREKVNRFKERYPERDRYYIYAYGDSKGDYALLRSADKAFYRKFVE